jgi:hypothetical protein
MSECIKPLPYNFFQDGAADPRAEVILNQVSEHCGISYKPYKGSNNEHTERDDVALLWKKIWLAIRFLSLHACWTDGDDDTLITQCRTQRATANQLCGCTKRCCNCDDDHIIIPLEYAPVNEEPFVSGTITVMVAGKFVKKELTAEYLDNHLDPYTNKLYIMRDDFPDIFYWNHKCCCMCKRQLTITLQYNAGYEKLPNGLLPLICPIISKIDDAKISLSDCASAMTKTVGLLKRKKNGNVEYEWSDKDNGASATETLLTDIFDVALVAELQAISRCGEISVPEEFGDVI